MERLLTIPFGVGRSQTTDAFHDDERHIHACFHHPLVYRIKDGTVSANEQRQLGITGVVNDDPFFGDPRNDGGLGAYRRDDFLPFRQRPFSSLPSLPPCGSCERLTPFPDSTGRLARSPYT